MSHKSSDRHSYESKVSDNEHSEQSSERVKTSRARVSQIGVGPSIPTPRPHVPERFEAVSDSDLRRSNGKSQVGLTSRPQGFMQPPPTELVAPGSATFWGGLA